MRPIVASHAFEDCVSRKICAGIGVLVGKTTLDFEISRVPDVVRVQECEEVTLCQFAQDIAGLPNPRFCCRCRVTRGV